MRLVADATGADALPLLAFTQLFKLHGAGHELTLAQYNEIGGMGGCVTRVLRQAQKSAETAGSDDNLRRLIVPGLATSLHDWKRSRSRAGSAYPTRSIRRYAARLMSSPEILVSRL
jgi:hypothetical protein